MRNEYKNSLKMNTEEKIKTLEQENQGLKKQIAELNTEYNMFRGLLITIPDNVYFKDMKSRFVKLSDHMIKWFQAKNGITKIIGKTDYDMFTNEHAQEAFDDEQNIIRTGESIINKEERETWEDGSQSWVSTSKVPLYDENKNVIGIVGISRDITEKKVAEAKLIEYQKNIETAKHEMDNILENVEEGLFLLANNYCLSSQYSAELETILGEASLEKKSLIDILSNKIPRNELKSLTNYLELLFDEINDIEMLNELNPVSEIELSVEGGQKFLSFKFKRIIAKTNKNFNLIVTVKDVTNEVLLKRSLELSRVENKRKIQWMLSILNVDSSLLKEFIELVQHEFDEMNDYLKKLSKSPKKKSLFDGIHRSVHTIKGNASLLELDFFAKIAHETENLFAELKGMPLSSKVVLNYKHAIGSLSEMYQELKSLIKQISKIHENFNSSQKQMINPLINSITKMVKKLGNAEGKEIDLDVKRFDINSVLNSHKLIITDALVQLVRNAIVHGIETAAEREKNKKALSAKIEISTINKAQKWGIRFLDNGRGLDIDALRKKAHESGKWEGVDINTWSDKRISELIFEPGISTAEKTSLTAGRGVGMDVLLKKIQSKDGIIDVDTKQNEYTSFTIIFPRVNA